MFTHFILDEPKGLVRVFVGRLGLQETQACGTWCGQPRCAETGTRLGRLAGSQAAVGRGLLSSLFPPSSGGSRARLSALFISVPLPFCPRLAFLTSVFYLCLTSVFLLPCHLSCVPHSFALKSYTLLLLLLLAYLTFLFVFLSSDSLEEDVTGLLHLSLQATSEPCVKLASTVVPGERQPCLVQCDSPALCPQSRCAEGGCHVSGPHREYQELIGYRVSSFIVLEQDIHCGIFFPLIVLALLLYYNICARV